MEFGSALETSRRASWTRPVSIRSNSSRARRQSCRGLAAIGGSVNFVSRQPTTGPIKNELDTSIDTLGTYRTHFGSGGSTNVQGLDYRFDVSSSKIASFIDGDYQQLNNVSGQLNYRVNDAFKVFAAIDYKRDDGHAYWGTPLTTTAFSGPFSTHGVVAGSAVNIFTGDLISPVTVELADHQDQLQRRRQLRLARMSCGCAAASS